MTQLSHAVAGLARPAHALLRVGIGLLFLPHGLQKFGFLAGSAGALSTTLRVAGVLEIFGGVLLVLGLWTRPIAFLLLGEMLVAFLTVHHPRGGWPIQNGGELPLLYALVFAFLIGAGSGPASVSELIRGAAPPR